MIGVIFSLFVTIVIVRILLKKWGFRGNCW